ncbi:MAG: tetratricopeptide repeat protein [Acidobacteriota bacterium]
MKRVIFALLALASPQAPDPLDAIRVHVTTGAAAGYVDDKHCATCHSDLARSYRHVGMSKSFYRPRADDAIEDFAKLPFRHARSGDLMELRWRDGKLVYRRWQADASGKPINLFEQPVDWILGSGHHARTYLYQTPIGEIYQLPLAWYTQTKEWAMAPGYDRPDHQGVLRRVRHECLFCHNGYPEIAENTRDGSWRKQGVPAQLPEGIGCQRCHGPGAEHMRRALGSADDAAVRAAIVKPTRLAPRLRNDVCYECHMQPSIAISPIRRLGRDVYSFRPGQALPDYLLQLDISDPELPKSERFEINHAPYRLEQSRCFKESGAKLFCLDCHDPHRKAADTSRYRNTCQTCHNKTEHQTATTDCVSCHMPKRRTQDVVHVTMTDHRIQTPVPSANFLAPREERDPVIEEVTVYDRERAPADAALYRVLAAARAESRRAPAAAQRLEELLVAAPHKEIEPYFDLGAAQLRQRRNADLEKTALAILARAPDHPLATQWLGLARVGLGRREEGLELMRKAAKLDPQLVEIQFNLGLLAGGEEAIAAFQRAVEGRPNFVLAWFHLGEAQQGERAIAAYRRTLDIDPTFTRAYLALSRALVAGGDREEALRYLRHGAKAAAKPEQVREALKRVEAELGGRLP